MKFNEYTYTRPDMDVLAKEVDGLLAKFEAAATAEVQNDVISSFYKLSSSFETMSTLVSIRNSIDTRDEFYDGEMDFMNEVSPIYEGIVDRYYQALLNSKFREELEKKWGVQLFRIAELKQKTFAPEIVEELQAENRLTSQYSKLAASASILFEGEERNLSQMVPFTTSKDRTIRKAASEAVAGFFQAHETEFDEIYDKLVKVRHSIAKKLGYDNFVKLGYARMTRSDYNPEMVANYRKQVLDHIVPVATKLKKRQQTRLGLSELKFYDEALKFLTGNPAPKGSSEWILENGKKMYHELSRETDEFFRYMVDKDLLDLDAKKGKHNGGYCTYISEYKSPFIFSNFNGTYGDVDVLTHEAGHAFQVYQSRAFENSEYWWSTSEAAEIHSMSMEFLTWPWMKQFFEEDEVKYKFMHLSEALLFIPYGVLVDEFQHWVYENPEATPTERKSFWRKTEQKYLPHRDYGDNAFLEQGGFWFRQLHIFVAPFYYIDYTLAQVCAFQFWIKSEENREAAWADYLRLCGLGGSKSFLELVSAANLKSPFENGSLKAVIDPIEQWLDNIEDQKL